MHHKAKYQGDPRVIIFFLGVNHSHGLLTEILFMLCKYTYIYSVCTISIYYKVIKFSQAY